MSHILHVTCHTNGSCHKSQVTNNFTNDPVCHIFSESLYKIYNGHDKNVACDISYMSHVTHVTCHKYQLTKILLKTQCVIYFWKAPAKFSSIISIKILHINCLLYICDM